MVCYGKLFCRMQAGYELFDLPQETIDLTFGVVTLATGKRRQFSCP